MSLFSPSAVSPKGLEDFLHRTIPLTRSMGLRIASITPETLVAEAPLEPNRNHLGTAFGGSLQIVPVIACYSSLWLLLREAGIDAHVVIKRGETDYKFPVTGPIRASTPRPTPQTAEDFLRDYRRHRKARMDLTATVEGAPNGKPAVLFRGSFVAIHGNHG